MSGEFVVDLSGTAAIVTGAASGIGFAIAEVLCGSGAGVLLVDLDAARLAGCVETLNASGPGRAIGLSVDIAGSDAGDKCVKRCEEAFGRIDILVNNAGIFPLAELSAITDEFFNRLMDINLRSIILLTKAAAPSLARDGGGTVINIGSMDALRPTLGGLTCYGASKAGVLSATRHLARELGPAATRVNAIVPGAVHTEGSAGMAQAGGLTEEELAQMMESFAAQIPLRRMATARDIAPVALFLASSASGYMSGSTVVVDGGMLQV